MRLGILGTGNVAQILARHWAGAGHQVTFGSRDPAGRDGLEAPVTTLAEAVAGSEVVVNATPRSASLETIQGIGADAFAGKILIDVANANTPSFELVYAEHVELEGAEHAVPGSAHIAGGGQPVSRRGQEPPLPHPVRPEGHIQQFLHSRAAAVDRRAGRHGGHDIGAHPAVSGVTPLAMHHQMPSRSSRPISPVGDEQPVGVELAGQPRGERVFGGGPAHTGQDRPAGHAARDQPRRR
jgi:hypothetical protein